MSDQVFYTITDNKVVLLATKWSEQREITSIDEKNKDEVMLQTLTNSSDNYFISSENMDILYISSAWNNYVSFYFKN